MNKDTKTFLISVGAIVVAYFAISLIEENVRGKSAEKQTTPDVNEDPENGEG